VRSGSLYASTQKVHRSRSQSPLHFDIWNIWQIRSENSFSSALRLLPEDMFERWPRVCHFRITFTLLLTNRFVSTTTNSMKCLANWIPLRTRLRSRNARPHLTRPLLITAAKGVQSEAKRSKIHCSILQHTARHCNTLQHNAAHGSTPFLEVTDPVLPHIATHCNTPQKTASFFFCLYIYIHVLINIL